jgi:glutamate N-acetyltransferase / amino-acid N-acetyltransferase
MNIHFNKYKEVPGGICVVDGFTAAGIHCGIRKNKSKKDLALIYSDKPCVTAAVYTQNKVKGAPIAVNKRHLVDGISQAIICNSGNANTCNADGEEKAEQMAQITGKALGLKPEDVIVCSTGVIGLVLPIESIADHIDEIAAKLSKDGNTDAANAIMTTDTIEKEVSIEFELGGKPCHIGGMAKGSGMIHPNMATMLSFLSTDVNIDQKLLKKALKFVVDHTFNMISIDGDTSTNDTVTLMSNCTAGNELIEQEDESYNTFTSALYVVMEKLCKMLAKDGEGATKLIECEVLNAKTEKIAQSVAKAVITSSLFKAAVFGADANWGRILCAIGYAEGDFDIDKVSVRIASKTKDTLVCKNGMGVDFSEEKAQFILFGDEIKIVVDMHDGEYSATAWGCDLTYDYVKINGEYRT